MDSLSRDSRDHYEAFHDKCDDVLNIARRLGQTGAAALETYDSHLAELREVYVRLLVLVDTFARYSQDQDARDPGPRIAAVEKELEREELSESVRASREATQRSEKLLAHRAR